MTSEAAPRDISAEPAEHQVITHDGKNYKTIREGMAYILVPETAAKAKPVPPEGGGESQSVFYNPIQQFNRDLTVLAIKAHGEKVLPNRVEALEKRQELFATKKRKRQERRAQQSGESEPPNKIAKLEGTDGLAQESKTELDAETIIAPVEQPANGDAEPVDTTPADPTGETTTSDATRSQSSEKGPRLKILDALSATGLRALRYAHELPFPTTVTSNDLLDAAVETIKLNVRHNKLEDSIVVTRGDALAHMYRLIADELEKTTGQNQQGKKNLPRPKSDKYDVIDLDPYGSAAQFIDAAVQAVRDDGGLLCVTCTDPSVWASNGYPEKSFALYGGVSVKGFHSHEAGLRLILNSIATSASRYGLAIEPLLSLSIDYYARLFVRVTRSPASVKFQASKTMIVYSCDSGCGAWETQPLLRSRPEASKKGGDVFYKHSFALAPTADKTCVHCGYKMHLSGPMYAGRIHSPEFIQSILDDLPKASADVYGTTDRIRGMLVTALEEHLDSLSSPALKALEKARGRNKPSNGTEEPKQPPSKEDAAADAAAASLERLHELDPTPFFFSTSILSGVVHCTTPSEDGFRGALRRLGYRVTRSHCKPGSIKTDAPWSVVWDVMRAWVKQKPVKESSIRPGTAAWHILRMDHGKNEEAAGAGEADDATKNGVVTEADEKKQVQSPPPEPEIVFDADLGREKNREKLVRYQFNPRENWGPMSRASGKS